MRATAIVAALTIGLSSLAFAGDERCVGCVLTIPGPQPIDEDVVNAYRLCEADYRDANSYAAVTSAANPLYRIEGCSRVLEIYRHEKEVRDKQFIDHVISTYTGDPVSPRPPRLATPELHGLTSPK